MEGKVKWYNRKKGYGFIEGDDGVEYFIHYSALKSVKFIRDNDRVSFDAADTDKGKQAQNVVLLQKGSELEGGSSSAPKREQQDDEESNEENNEDFDDTQDE